MTAGRRVLEPGYGMTASRLVLRVVGGDPQGRGRGRGIHVDEYPIAVVLLRGLYVGPGDVLRAAPVLGLRHAGLAGGGHEVVRHHRALVRPFAPQNGSYAPVPIHGSVAPGRGR